MGTAARGDERMKRRPGVEMVRPATHIRVEWLNSLIHPNY